MVRTSIGCKSFGFVLRSLRIVLISAGLGGLSALVQVGYQRRFRGLSTTNWVLIGLVSFGIGVGWVLLGMKVKAVD